MGVKVTEDDLAFLLRKCDAAGSACDCMAAVGQIRERLQRIGRTPRIGVDRLGDALAGLILAVESVFETDTITSQCDAISELVPRGSAWVTAIAALGEYRTNVRTLAPTCAALPIIPDELAVSVETMIPPVAPVSRLLHGGQAVRVDFFADNDAPPQGESHSLIEFLAGRVILRGGVPSAIVLESGCFPPYRIRHRLPTTREGVTHKFSIAGHEGYLTVGTYADGRLGETFIRISKEGSTLGGLLDAIGMLISVGLQFGVPLEVICEKLRDTRYEPNGPTTNPEIPVASSILDYVAAWFGQRFLGQPPRPMVDLDADLPTPGDGKAAE